MKHQIVMGSIMLIGYANFLLFTGRAQGPYTFGLTVIFIVLGLIGLIGASFVPEKPKERRPASPLVRIFVGLTVLMLLLGLLGVVAIANALKDSELVSQIFGTSPAEPAPAPRWSSPPPMRSPIAPPGGVARTPAEPPPPVPTTPPVPLAKPAYTPPPGQPGEPTELVGGPEGWQFQSFDSDRRPVLGFRFVLGSWGNQPAIAEFTPLFERDAPAGGASLAYGREGYVVGALQVAASDLVNAVRIVFVRQQPNGTLDKDKAYVSDWIGDPGNKPISTIGNRESLVIGVCGRQGAVKIALALILDRTPPASAAAVDSTKDVAADRAVASVPATPTPTAPKPPPVSRTPTAPRAPVYNPPPTLPGRPTELAGGPKGWQFETCDQGRKTVVGFRHRMGSWARQPAVAQLEPLYDRNQSKGSGNLVIAPDDYVVGGVQVVSGDLVNAVRIIFVRQQTDGSLDKGNFYLSDWIGDPGDNTPKALGDGRTRVIGICGRRGAVLNALALVLDNP